MIAIQKVSVRYTTALLQKRISLKTPEDRKRLADRVIEVGSGSSVKLSGQKYPYSRPPNFRRRIT